MSYKPSDTYHGEFVTSSPTTGAATNADSLPVATANHNGTDDGTFVLTVTPLATGRYGVSGTIPSGYGSGHVVNVSVAATVGGVGGVAVVDTFLVDTKRLSDTLSVALVASGLDAVMVTASLNARRVLNSLLSLAGAGKLNGVPAKGVAGTVVLRDPDDTVDAVSIPVDGNGNRPGPNVLNPPA